ncbi:helicase [Reticulibacter mediterranei]|uniref:Helicase n=1 Tax=Reticulibacter mediterranei TaxID=2778369 RepID=A0A8J3ILP4_9CHLR|nr:DEAD/DEAH box helicase [Reticulibacter mediterranei]GHO96168.1 helicase [Reticulibacter mediterranei]
MHIIHGTWIPNEGEQEEFIQAGAFYLWIETDAPPDSSWRSAEGVHPRHLKQTALAAFLMNRLNLQNSIGGDPMHDMCMQYFLLPTVAGRPTPSFELVRYVDEEAPTTFELMPWQICCYRVVDIVSVLNDIHFAALHTAEDFQLGADLLFWYQYTQVLKGVIAKDQYIPSMKYQVILAVVTKKQRVKKHESVELHYGWELLSKSYEEAIQRYATAMPFVCTAGMSSANNVALFAKESLLRHFSECLLVDIITGTSFTGKFDRIIDGTLLYKSIYPSRIALFDASVNKIEDYKHWLAWRAKLIGVHTEAGFTLCFRLEEAPASNIDNWYLHFFVAARHDPSLKLSLSEYWDLTPHERVEVARPFGQDFEKNLLLALGYAARVYPEIWSGLATAQPAGCQLTLDEAFAFLKESAWVLGDAGYTVIVPAWWTPQGRRRAKVRLKTSVHSPKGTAAAIPSHLNLKAIVSYEYQLSIGGQVVSSEEWQQLVNAKTPLVQFRGQWMELDREKMQQMLQFWQTHRNETPEISLLDLLKISSEAEDDLEWEHDQSLHEMLARLQDKNAFAPIEDPVALQGNLRDYQRRGVAWLQYLEQLGLNPCLADDMGLGKTLEVIAHLLKEREKLPEGECALPTLVIAPTSVLGNWRREIERFAPQLRVVVHQGSNRMKEKQTFIEACQAYDVVLTSFALARLDEKLLQGVSWRRVVVDEAQNIKNPQAAQTRAILKLAAPHRLALTGTPVENRLRDLWSIFNFLNPGYLGKEAQFRKSFETPIYKSNDLSRSETLKKLVEPFILRRVKTDKRIINDLPDKIEQKMYCTLSPEQASLYEAVVNDVSQQIEQAEGMQRRGLILSTLLKLKQICNHPAQFLQDGSAFTTERSHKLQRLGEMIEEVIESGESALVFTQFTEIGSALERYLEHNKHYNTYYLHGGTSVTRRDQMVTEFQDPETEPSLFILSLRAGGVGLNLTKANHVFHFDRWWNPAVEDQATDRAFRIGQRKNVFVHKFVALGTMEERIDAMIEDKKRLSSLVVGTDESWLTELDNDTFKDLIALRRSAVVG